MLALGLEHHLIGTAYLDDAIPERWLTAYKSVPVIAKQYPAREVVMAQSPDFLFAGFASAFGEKRLGPEKDWNALGIGTYVVNAECRNQHPDDVMLEFWVDPESPYHKPIFAEDKMFIIHCASGWRSLLASATLQSMGLKPVRNLKGGFAAWREAGGPVEALPARK